MEGNHLLLMVNLSVATQRNSNGCANRLFTPLYGHVTHKTLLRYEMDLGQRGIH
jgi:hypothetical protein